MLDTILQEQQQRLQNRNNRVYHPIRLEGCYNDTYDRTAVVDTREGISKTTVPEFESSILLHNLGLAYLCMSLICCKTPTTSSMMTTNHHTAFLSLQYRNKALQCFGKSYVIYAKALSMPTTSYPSSNDCLDWTFHLQGMILIVHNIIRMFQMCRNDLDIPCMEYDATLQHYQTVLNHTIQKLQDTQVRNDMLGFTCVTAGAA
jgi:hypothetical protein